MHPIGIYGHAAPIIDPDNGKHGAPIIDGGKYEAGGN